jgi:enoyl-CoA hydratase/carnithine racemase
MSATGEQPVAVERRGSTVVVTINRPSKMNALTPDVFDALLEHVPDHEQAGTDAVVITGSGDKAFSAGSDLKYEAKLDPSGLARYVEHGQAALTRLETCPIPVIAAIRGHCLGGGLELALACDLRLAAPTASLGLPEVGIGSLPGWGGTYRLQRVIGQARAKELILFGRRLDADTALAWGLVAEVIEDPLERAVAIADSVEANSNFGKAKLLVRDTWSLALADAQRLEGAVVRGD